jgi:hypothetical protein
MAPVLAITCLVASKPRTLNPRGSGIEDALLQELNDSCFEVVHRARNLYAAAGFKVPKHRALFSNVGDS